MRLIHPLFSSLLFSLCSSSLIADVYKVIDENGNVTYTDQPNADLDTAAVEKLPPLNKIPALALPAADKPNDDQPLAFPGYNLIAIASPENDEVILHNQVSISVRLALDPPLQPGHRVQYLFDGLPQGPTVPVTEFQIGNIVRGAHQLSAKVFGAQGQLLGSTAAIKVHVKRSFARK